MKIIFAGPPEHYNKSCAGTLEKIYGSCVRLLADTALLTHRKPVFVPDWGGKCMATGCVAARISRLGKSIEPRFAERYVDAVGLAVKFELCTLRKRFAEKGLPCDIAESFDGAVSAGEWLETDIGKIESLTARFTFGSQTAVCSCSDWAAMVENAVTTASRFFTIRQGDVMIVPLEGARFEAVPNTHVTGTLGEKRLLEFNIK